jgi:hypothetical protein
MLKRVNHQFAKLSHEHETLCKFERNLITDVNKTDSTEKRIPQKNI